MLRATTDLDTWLLESGVIDAGPRSRAADLEDALVLREAIYTLVRARIVGDTYGDEALEIVNGTALAPSAPPQLRESGRKVEATAAQALSWLARRAIDIVGGSDAEFLKECARPGCTQVYIDRSRGSRREWCAMDSCGNTMKAAAYRARKREVRGDAASQPRRRRSVHSTRRSEAQRPHAEPPDNLTDR